MKQLEIIQKPHTRRTEGTARNEVGPTLVYTPAKQDRSLGSFITIYPVVNWRRVKTVLRKHSPMVIKATAVAGSIALSVAGIVWIVQQVIFWLSIGGIAIVLMLISAARNIRQSVPFEYSDPGQGPGRDVITNVHVEGPVGNVVTNVYVNQKSE